MPVQKRTPAATPEQVVSARGHRTQEAVAKLLDVSVNTIQNWEHGRAPIPRWAYRDLIATNEPLMAQILAEMEWKGTIPALPHDPHKESPEELPCHTG